MVEVRNVLVVDDNRDLADNICEILETLEEPRLELLVAPTGADALELAARTDFDLAIVDLRLPDTDGLRLTEQLREACPFVEVVLITGDATIESAIEAVRSGAFSYVVKPFRAAQVLDTAAQALEKSGLFREREHLRGELAKSELAHREVVEAVPAFVLALDEAGQLVIWNRRLEEATGLDREQMLGRPGSDLVREAEVRLPGRDGEPGRLARWQLARMETATGRITYAVGVDVTEEREMLRRTMRAERLAAVGTLAAGLAHEVRNPLNSALLQLQVLRRRVERGQTDKLSGIVGVVTDEIHRLDRLVREFLDFARPRPFEAEETDLAELLEGIAELVAPEAASHGIEVRRELPRRVALAAVEKARIQQVALNLVRNGLEAMPEGGTLSLRVLAPAGGMVGFEVGDTGPGFAEEERIFDAFYTTKDSGTGLGLAIVHRIVSEHDGSVDASSKPGDTRFSVRLPQAVRSH